MPMGEKKSAFRKASSLRPPLLPTKQLRFRVAIGAPRRECFPSALCRVCACAEDGYEYGYDMMLDPGAGFNYNEEGDPFRGAAAQRRQAELSLGGSEDLETERWAAAADSSSLCLLMHNYLRLIDLRLIDPSEASSCCSAGSL